MNSSYIVCYAVQAAATTICFVEGMAQLIIERNILLLQVVFNEKLTTFDRQKARNTKPFGPQLTGDREYMELVPPPTPSSVHRLFHKCTAIMSLLFVCILIDPWGFWCIISFSYFGFFINTVTGVAAFTCLVASIRFLSASYAIEFQRVPVHLKYALLVIGWLSLLLSVVLSFLEAFLSNHELFSAAFLLYLVVIECFGVAWWTYVVFTIRRVTAEVNAQVALAVSFSSSDSVGTPSPGTNVAVPASEAANVLFPAAETQLMVEKTTSAPAVVSRAPRSSAGACHPIVTFCRLIWGFASSPEVAADPIHKLDSFLAKVYIVITATVAVQLWVSVSRLTNPHNSPPDPNDFATGFQQSAFTFVAVRYPLKPLVKLLTYLDGIGCLLE